MKNILINVFTKNVILGIFFAGVIIASSIIMYHHEVWRDEAQAFLVARDSNGLFDLFHNLRPEGHPGLWHFLLYIGYKVSGSIYVMQVIHLVIGLASIALILWYSPFNIIQRMMLSCSYFLSYEYLIISRDYAIGIFLLLLSITLYARMAKNYKILVVAVLLGLSINSNFYTLILSVFTFGYFVCLYIKQNKLNNIIPLIFSCVILLIFLMVAYLELRYIPGRFMDHAPYLTINWHKIISTSRRISEVIFFVPTPRWNYPWLWSLSDQGVTDGVVYNCINYIFKFIPLLLCILLFAALAKKIKNDLPLLTFFILSFLTFFLFDYVIFQGAIRHLGFFFILLVVTSWLHLLFNKDSLAELTATKIFSILFSISISLQVIGSIYMNISDYDSPFSDAKDTAEFLIKENLVSQKTLFSPGCTSTGIIYYAGMKKGYYPESKSYLSFTVWTKYQYVFTQDSLLTMIKNENINMLIFQNKYNTTLPNDSLLIVNGFRLIRKARETHLLTDENFLVYKKD